MCVTNPPTGEPMYVSRCCEWFHMNVPTRSPSSSPSFAETDDELLRPRDEVGVRVAVPALVGQAARDLVLAVQLVGSAEECGDVELVVHHQAVHVVSLLV